MSQEIENSPIIIKNEENEVGYTFDAQEGWLQLLLQSFDCNTTYIFTI